MQALSDFLSIEETPAKPQFTSILYCNNTESTRNELITHFPSAGPLAKTASTGASISFQLPTTGQKLRTGV